MGLAPGGFHIQARECMGFRSCGGYCVFISVRVGLLIYPNAGPRAGGNRHVGGLPREVEVGSVTHLTGMSMKAMSQILRNHDKISRTDHGHMRRVLGRLSCRPGVCTDTLTSGGGCAFTYLLPGRLRNRC